MTLQFRLRTSSHSILLTRSHMASPPVDGTSCFAGIPVWISWFKYLSFIFYGYGLLAHIEFQDRQLYLCTYNDTAPGERDLGLRVEGGRLKV